MADQGRSNPGTCFWIASPSVRNDVAETMTQAEKEIEDFWHLQLAT
jgi:hypothetical protein